MTQKCIKKHVWDPKTVSKIIFSNCWAFLDLKI